MGFSAPMSKPQRDLRIGYGALGVGAAAFVLMTVTTLYVTDTDLPGLPVAQPPSGPLAQQVAEARVLVRAAAPAAGVDGPTVGVGAPAGGLAAGDGVAPAPQGGTSPGGSPGSPSDPGPGPTTPGGVPGPGPDEPDPVGPDPGPGPDPDRRGPVSGLVDPVVAGAVGAVDGLTGGALAPVTGAVQDTTDGLTDTLDGLLGGPLRSGR